MLYSDNEHKFVAVLNKKTDLPYLMNALGHMTAGLLAQCENLEAMRFLDYRDSENKTLSMVSHYPFIVLIAKNGNQIRTLRKAAEEAGILYNCFADSMLGSSAEEQLGNTRNTKEADLEYFGICLFGASEILNPLTKKFSLFKG
jgi:hypothetical protein